MQFGQLIKTQDNAFNGQHPNAIDVGYERRGIIFTPPVVGQYCAVGGLRTSLVTAVEKVNEFHTKVTTKNSEYCLLTGMTFGEVEFIAAVRKAMLATEPMTIELQEGFLPFARATKVLEAFGLKSGTEHFDTNGWQLDFWLDGVDEDGVEVLTYSGSLWGGNEFKLIRK